MFSMLALLASSHTPVWMASDRRQAPRWLRPDVLWRSLERVLDDDAECRRLNRRILRAETSLRQAATDEAWTRYVSIDELKAARALRWGELAARWAYAEARRRR
jgi:hypothetical protein